ncbi:GntR family transcriptional regulator [Bacillus sp. Bva_UNVM-123]|uniref:GntR family transcriptional regulator n=1 Tax=Bacillus sp. Bva_UNVM-123 TaxID=2829798 RepID=UPI00391EE274
MPQRELKEVLRANYNEESKVPKYLKIRSSIRHIIEKGLVKENEALPTESELCEVFDVSRMTVRQAIDELVREGFLERQSGAGTFVKTLRLKGRLRTIQSFSGEIALMGKSTNAQLISVEVVAPNDEISNKLLFTSDMKALLIKRVRFVDEEPIAFLNSYLPFHIFKDLLDEDLNDPSLYDLISEKYNFTMSHGVENIQAIEMPRTIAPYLNCLPESSCFHVSRVSFVKELDFPFEYVETILRGDKFIFTNELKY